MFTSSRVAVRSSNHLCLPHRIVWRIWTARLTAWWSAVPLTPHRWRTSVMLSMAASPSSRTWLPADGLNLMSPIDCISSSGTWMMKSLGSSKRVPPQLMLTRRIPVAEMSAFFFCLFMTSHAQLNHTHFCPNAAQRKEVACEFGGLRTWFDRCTESEEETQETGGWAGSSWASHSGGGVLWSSHLFNESFAIAHLIQMDNKVCVKYTASFHVLKEYFKIWENSKCEIRSITTSYLCVKLVSGHGQLNIAQRLDNSSQRSRSPLMLTR